MEMNNLIFLDIITSLPHFFMRHKRLQYILFYIVLPSMLSLAFWGFGFYAYSTQTALLEHGVKTEGTVVRFQEIRKKYGGFSYKPDVEFEDINQQKHTVTLSCTMSVNTGQKFPVLYLPSHPQTAFWAESRALSTRSYRFVLIFAVIFFCLPIWNTYVYKRLFFSDDPTPQLPAIQPNNNDAMTSLRFQNLKDAPRSVGVTAKLLCRFSTEMSGSWLLWFFVAAGFAVATWIFASLDKRDIMPTEWKSVAQARIVEKDNTSANNFKRYAFEWKSPGGATNHAECFSKYQYQIGDSVPVVCSLKDESLVKLEGGAFGTENRAWLVFIPLVWGMMFLIILVELFRQGNKDIHLLRFGTPVFAQIQSYAQNGQTYVKHFPIIKFSVVFQASDKTLHAVDLCEVRKNMNSINSKLPVFYDSDNPGSFVRSFGMIPKGITYNSPNNMFQGQFFALFPIYLGMLVLTITFVWIFVYLVSLLF